MGFLRKLLVASIVIGFVISCNTTETPEILPAPIALKVGEGFVNPIGYYEAEPRFSWQLGDSLGSGYQMAYQIQVSSTVASLSVNPDLWDSGKVFSTDNAWQRYQGNALDSRDIALWRVRIWDNNGNVSEWSKPQSIEMGLLATTDWRAHWIGHPQTALSAHPSQERLATPQYLRKTFNIDGEVQSARLYITAKGLFSAFANGVEIAPNDVMTPGWTPYDKRIESLTYDVTTSLVQGENALAATIAGGWYAGRIFKFTEKDHTLPARLLAQLEITYQDGRVQRVVSDDSWRASQQGPIRFASIYDGEHYDQSFEIEGWTTAAFVDENWVSATASPLDGDVKIVPKRHNPIRTTEHMTAKAIVSVEGDKVVFDFGQNMVGVPKLALPVLKGQEVQVRYAEALHKGEFYTDNYRSAKSENRIMPSESGLLEYQPRFTYHGYRYLEVTGFDTRYVPNISWATAQIQHSDVDIHASFTSSHPKLNQLSQNIVWGLRSNFFDIPLDCPQRDERLGWTGDAQVFVTPSMYMADVYGFWSAWLQSIREEQAENGKVPLYIPYVEWLNFASSGWGDAVTIIPWELYMLTGDKSVLEDNYDMMMSWVQYHHSQSEGFVSSMSTFGDWLQPYPVITKEGDNGNRGNTDFSLIGTAYFARSVELTMKTAQVLGRTQDEAQLYELHQKVKHAFATTFFDENLNLINAIPTQTTYLLGLAYDLFPPHQTPLAVDKLIGLLEQADMHLRTGFLGTPLLTQVLQDAGRSDIIYELLFQETYPSWFYSINNGATTTWERWNSYSLEDGFNSEGMNSLNHYAYGTVSRWFYEGILGIKPLSPGFKQVLIAPQIGARLTEAKGSYNTPQGKVGVEWKKQGNHLVIHIEIPPNTQGHVVIPDPSLQELTLNGVPVEPTRLNNLRTGGYEISAYLQN
ncbi:alpha-L-rhamnosidase [Alteromonas sp. KUL49]|uniref:alpha-L-rhamnosidase n=1 Tax=Alteromonas sp. KUL49 TaxID=2480798 RepID=UPI00102EF1E7|nr:alpha-L-rhamnosidase [Alteromonas sp. KUL49]TAP42267.1 rhamnosidase [Alteromonas sp. KUL49]GEA09859.1 alpha-L-rhamnosidase [Alteromonas sp. KUL49]